MAARRLRLFTLAVQPVRQGGRHGSGVACGECAGGWGGRSGRTDAGAVGGDGADSAAAL